MEGTSLTINRRDGSTLLISNLSEGAVESAIAHACPNQVSVSVGVNETRLDASGTEEALLNAHAAASELSKQRPSNSESLAHITRLVGLITALLVGLAIVTVISNNSRMSQQQGVEVQR